MNLLDPVVNIRYFLAMKSKEYTFIWIALIIIALVFLFFPAHKGGLLTWGVNGGGAPAMLSFSTKGIAFLFIWLIEAVVLQRFLTLSWGRAIFGSFILNAFSTILGIMVALVAFSATITIILVLGAYAVLTLRIFVVEDKLPTGFTTYLIGSVFIGSVFVYYTAGVLPPQSPIVVYVLMAVPLLIGFGMSIMLEMLIAGKVLGVPNAWRGILPANIYSFILLALLVPTFSDNIYDGKDKYFEDALVNKITEGAEISGIIRILKDKAAPTPYLLGLSGDSTPRGAYWAGMESDVLIEAYSGSDNPDPAIGLAITGQVLTYPELYEQSEEEFTWLEGYFSHWIDARDEFGGGGGERSYFESTINEWESWYDENDPPYNLDDLPDPQTVADTLYASVLPDTDRSQESTGHRK